jgi:amidohydrolase
LAEYDALPGYGPEKKPAHACGHNWIAASTVGAAVMLAKLKARYKGRIVVFGTPAEESAGRKIDLAKQGAFDDMGAIFQMHLYENTNLKARALAMDSWEFRFAGKASHAAAYPYEGINALDAVNLTFAGVNALRQQLQPDARVCGIITEGGEAPNIIPDKGVCKFYVRAARRDYLNAVSEKIKNCARGAALMTGAALEIREFEGAYDDLMLNHALLNLMYKNMRIAGFEEFSMEEEIPGSTDVGNVSHRAPVLYGNVGVAEGEARVHEEAFLNHANGAEAKEKLSMTAKAFVLSALDLLNDPGLLARVREEFEAARRAHP